MLLEHSAGILQGMQGAAVEPEVPEGAELGLLVPVRREWPTYKLSPGALGDRHLLHLGPLGGPLSCSEPWFWELHLKLCPAGMWVAGSLSYSKRTYSQHTQPWGR